MALRLVISFTAAAGRGAELAEAFKARCEDVVQEPGCLQFEVFRSVVDPDKLTALELWADEAALEAHRQVNATRAPLPRELFGGPGQREDYLHAPGG